MCLIDDIGRECSQCLEYKMWSFYSKNKVGVRGHSSSCKLCRNNYKRAKRGFIKETLTIDDNGRECTKCRDYKLWDLFYKKTGSPFDKDYQCMGCRKESSTRWKHDNDDKVKSYRQHIKTIPDMYNKSLKRSLKNYFKNRDANLEKMSDYSKSKKRWLDDSRREYMRKYHVNRRQIDPVFKLEGNVRASMRYTLSLKGLKKEGRTFYKYLDYSLEDLIASLESKFTDGMDWGNYGKGGWHLDHICPIASFDFKSHKDVEFKKCWDIDNLQPLWEQDNWDKHDSITSEAISVRKHLDDKYKND